MPGLGSLFAPAYQAGNQQSIDAVDQWMATNFGMTNPKVEATRRPVSFNTGNPAGMVDPEALRVLAQGGPYDPTTRDQIAAAQLANKPAAAAGAGAGGAATNPYGTAPPGYGASILGASDWAGFSAAAGADAANAWAQQQYDQANNPQTILLNQQRSMLTAEPVQGYGGGFGGGAGDGSP
jgi:hypothetical protein